jgi:predicted nucleic acid-binding protein
LFATLDIELVGIDQLAVVAIAEAARLTAYDASYLWLARERSAELVTLDRSLAHAAAG